MRLAVHVAHTMAMFVLETMGIKKDSGQHLNCAKVLLAATSPQSNICPELPFSTMIRTTAD